MISLLSCLRPRCLFPDVQEEVLGSWTIQHAMQLQLKQQKKNKHSKAGAACRSLSWGGSNKIFHAGSAASGTTTSAFSSSTRGAHMSFHDSATNYCHVPGPLYTFYEASVRSERRAERAESQAQQAQVPRTHSEQQHQHQQHQGGHAQQHHYHDIQEQEQEHKRKRRDAASGKRQRADSANGGGSPKARPPTPPTPPPPPPSPAPYEPDHHRQQQQRQQQQAREEAARAAHTHTIHTCLPLKAASLICQQLNSGSALCYGANTMPIEHRTGSYGSLPAIDCGSRGGSSACRHLAVPCPCHPCYYMAGDSPSELHAPPAPAMPAYSPGVVSRKVHFWV